MSTTPTKLHACNCLRQDGWASQLVRVGRWLDRSSRSQPIVSVAHEHGHEPTQVGEVCCRR